MARAWIELMPSGAMYELSRPDEEECCGECGNCSV